MDINNKKPLAGIIGEFGLALKEVAKVGTFGASKYSYDGWLKIKNGQELYNHAMWRHLLEMTTNPIDESGLDHLAHIIFDALVQLELKLRKKKECEESKITLFN